MVPLWSHGRRFYSPALIVAAMRRKPRGYVAGPCLATVVFLVALAAAVGLSAGIGAHAYWTARDTPAPCHCMPEMEVRR